MHKLLDNEKLIVGFDLGNVNSQVSYCITDGNVESLSSVAGGEDYNIPTVLCKREGVNQWFYGREALRYANEGKGVLIDNLLELAKNGEMVLIEEKPFDPVALLTLFVKRSLGMLTQISSTDKIVALMITCENLDHRMLQILDQLSAGLKLKRGQICCQSHTESFYNYMIHQPPELWKYQVLLCEYTGNKMKVYRMECNQKTKPVVAFIDNCEYSFMEYEPMPEEETLRKDKMNRLDSEFLSLSTQICQGKIISSVFLIGDGFKEEWLRESLKSLCRGRRVFQGNNLYCKGACFGMLEKISASEVGKTHVFLGDDKLKANVGMKVMRRGESSYYALLDAGANWFEAEQTVEVYVQGGSELELRITPLMGNNSRNEVIALDGIGEMVSRIKIHLFMKDENVMVVEIDDLGLGMIDEGTGQSWMKEIRLC